MRTLRDAVEAADAHRFVGRAAQLRAFERLLDDDHPRRVLYIHGPGGIGKSTILRALTRVAASRGREVAALDAHAPLSEIAGQLDAAIGSALRTTRPLTIFLDEAEALGPALPALRDRLLSVVTDDARVVVASRQGPDPSWRADGLDILFIESVVPPLSDEEAAQLLMQAGVEPTSVPDTVAWAQGSPLALVVAASSTATAPPPAGSVDLEQRLTVWLTGAPTLAVADDVLAVAALAPAVDARLLAAALPRTSTREAFRALQSLPVVERRGDRLLLHAVLASAVRARLRTSSPDRARALTIRIATHLAARARLGDTRALVELSHFIEDDALRLALSNRPSATHFVDGAHANEIDTFARAHGYTDNGDWAELRAWAQRPGAFPVVVRAASGSAVLYAVFQGLGDVEPAGPVTESLSVAAHTLGLDGQRSAAGFILFADTPLHDRVEASRLGTGALAQQFGRTDLEALLVHFPEPDRRPADAVAAITRPLDLDLARPVGLTDFRPLGAAGFVEAVVLRGLGAEPRGGDALTALGDAHAEGDVARLARVLDDVFTDDPHDRRLRRAIELVTLDQRLPEAEILAAMHVSRRTWYRILREARERLAAHRGAW